MTSFKRYDRDGFSLTGFQRVSDGENGQPAEKQITPIGRTET